jgi:hypothetical protein
MKDEVLTRRMDEWCTNQHGKSGLTAACIASPLTHEDVTNKVLEYIQKWVPERGAALLAGSTVHADMRWVLSSLYCECRLGDLDPCVLLCLPRLIGLRDEMAELQTFVRFSELMAGFC